MTQPDTILTQYRINYGWDKISFLKVLLEWYRKTLIHDTCVVSEPLYCNTFIFKNVQLLKYLLKGLILQNVFKIFKGITEDCQM